MTDYPFADLVIYIYLMIGIIISILNATEVKEHESRFYPYLILGFLSIALLWPVWLFSKYVE